MMNRLLTLLVAISTFIGVAQGQNLLLKDNDAYRIRCTSFVYFEDPSGDLKIDDIRNLPEDSFHNYTKEVFNFGFTNNTYWLKTNVINNSSLTNYIFEIGQPNLDLVELYVGQKKEVKSDLVPFNKRDIKDPKPLFHIAIEPGTTQEVFVKISGKDELVVPIHIAHKDHMVNQSSLRLALFGFFAGILIVMILYNLFLFISLKSTIYFFYVINILALLLGQSSLLGYSNMYFWPNSGFWPNQGPIIFPLLSIVFGLLFASHFINLKRYSVWAVRAVNMFIVISLVGVTFSLLGKITVASIMLNATGMFSAIFLITVCAVLTKRRVNSAKFLLVAWTIFLVGVILYVLRSLSILEYSVITNYSMPIGTAIETLLLSFALADRINSLKKQREESQRLMLMEVKKNNDLTRNQNKILEEKVKSRTEELEAMNGNLQETLTNLKSTQGHLVEAEKMASLGHLTAGIAHEINNPINYVSSNVQPLRQDLEDILTVLNGYKEVAKGSDDEKLKALLEQEEELDLDYAIKEMHELLGGIEEGAKRTSEIVTGLKNFSRTDEDEAQSADINNGIQSTVTILKSELKSIDTHVELGQIPHIKCYLGKLNQVFMNIIDNAIDAIKARHEDLSKGELRIVSQEKDGNIVITISDNGCGMTDEVKNSIFDPFYTTKGVGEGTGLGLSITYGIMEKHKGTITVDSEVNVGTTFTIKLPIDNE